MMMNMIPNKSKPNQKMKDTGKWHMKITQNNNYEDGNSWYRTQTCTTIFASVYLANKTCC